ncbi:28S ribosomal protein S18c, mitochondrial isoform X1 [Egretta garzetta]|uniref:28S ribosomal protein S18c, mitochondrial isoform X1 n=1 Tax=Egretta garzetta TaxID=188379 RepID=UPI00163D25AA|nr:28S ribosomal protein S18c, mitochondrial isoform X1 [Egretta garzetta]
MSHEDLVPGSSRSWEPIQMENPYKDPPKRCILCGINVDYKNVQLLSQFVSPHTGCIYGRHITGLCDKKQKEITKAIKRAHVLGETVLRCRQAVRTPCASGTAAAGKGCRRSSKGLFPRARCS